MKKYPITFTTDYTDDFHTKNYPFKSDEPRQILIKKWKGKKISLNELEENIKEFETIVFDGRTIEIYNDYRE